MHLSFISNGSERLMDFNQEVSPNNPLDKKALKQVEDQHDKTLYLQIKHLMIFSFFSDYRWQSICLEILRTMTYLHLFHP